MTTKFDLQMITSNPYFLFGASVIEIGCSYKCLDTASQKLKDYAIKALDAKRVHPAILHILKYLSKNGFFNEFLPFKLNALLELTKEGCKFFTAVWISSCANQKFKFNIPFINLSVVGVFGTLIVTGISYRQYIERNQKQKEKELQLIPLFDGIISNCVHLENVLKEAKNTTLENKIKIYDLLNACIKKYTKQFENAKDRGGLYTNALNCMELNDNDQIDYADWTNSLKSRQDKLKFEYPFANQKYLEALIAIQNQHIILNQLDSIALSFRDEIVAEAKKYTSIFQSKLQKAENMYFMITKVSEYFENITKAKFNQLKKVIANTCPDFAVNLQDKTFSLASKFINYLDTQKVKDPQFLENNGHLKPLYQSANEIKEEVMILARMNSKGKNFSVDERNNIVIDYFKSLSESIDELASFLSIIEKNSDTAVEDTEPAKILAQFKKLLDSLKENFSFIKFPYLSS